MAKGASLGKGGCSLDACRRPTKMLVQGERDFTSVPNIFRDIDRCQTIVPYKLANQLPNKITRERVGNIGRQCNILSYIKFLLYLFILLLIICLCKLCFHARLIWNKRQPLFDLTLEGHHPDKPTQAHNTANFDTRLKYRSDIFIFTLMYSNRYRSPILLRTKLLSSFRFVNVHIFMVMTQRKSRDVAEC